jgi:hypothetical protein
MNDSYWTLDTSLFDGQFRYFGNNPVLVRGKVHIGLILRKLTDKADHSKLRDA